jgi:hypothetical protein
MSTPRTAPHTWPSSGSGSAASCILRRVARRAAWRGVAGVARCALGVLGVACSCRRPDPDCRTACPLRAADVPCGTQGGAGTHLQLLKISYVHSRASASAPSMGGRVSCRSSMTCLACAWRAAARAGADTRRRRQRVPSAAHARAVAVSSQHATLRERAPPAACSAA